MFGPSLPILFPIAFASFLITYLLEVFMLFYVFRLPVTYDEISHQAALKYLAYASLIATAFNFWLFSSHQLLTYPHE